MSEISQRNALLQAYNTIDLTLTPGRPRAARHTAIGNYELRQAIGMGGFAKVHKAIHIPTGEAVAVKVVSLRRLSDSKKNDLSREIEIHRNLVHQHIAQIYEVFEQNNNIYIFMEYCPKGELFEYINQKGPLPAAWARRIFQQIYSAVCYLHQNFIAHRDIKTENILLDEKGNAKLIDFGLSNYYGGENQPEFLNTFCGSPSYLSPEMIKRGKYQPKMVDVWCLGVTLYAMMRAELPFYHSDPAEQQKKIKTMNFKSVGEAAADELLGCIFVPASSRICLEDIQNSAFMQDGMSYCPNCLSPEAQNYAIDMEIVEEISKEYRICAQTILDSIKGKKLDSAYGLYFLTLQKNREMGKQSCYDVRSSSFMKNRDLRSLRKTERKHQTLELGKREPEYKTAPSTPKSIKTKKKLAALTLKKREGFQFKMLDPLGEAAQFNLGNIAKRPRRMSDDSPDRKLRLDERKIRKPQLLEI